eukprot:COSAG02_NODE_509_length_20882_cov_71.811914_5_plen_467_part_00
METNQACPICLRQLQQSADALRCGHKFHLQCLAAWTLSAAGNHSRCPSCRIEIIDPAETRANMFCAQCSTSLARDSHTLLWCTGAASNIWCNACTTSAFITGIRKRLVGIYAEHNPRKLDDVDALLEEWAGEEDKLLANVEAKYGLTTPLELIRAEIFMFYTLSNPRKLADIDDLLMQWTGEEEQLRRNVAAKYQRERHDAVQAIREHLQTIYSKHCPEKVGSIDELLEQWVDKEGQLVAKVQEKYRDPKEAYTVPSLVPPAQEEAHHAVAEPDASPDQEKERYAHASADDQAQEQEQQQEQEPKPPESKLEPEPEPEPVLELELAPDLEPAPERDLELEPEPEPERELDPNPGMGLQPDVADAALRAALRAAALGNGDAFRQRQEAAFEIPSTSDSELSDSEWPPVSIPEGVDRAPNWASKGLALLQAQDLLARGQALLLQRSRIEHFGSATVGEFGPDWDIIAR